MISHKQLCVEGGQEGNTLPPVIPIDKSPLYAPTPITNRKFFLWVADMILYVQKVFTHLIY